MENGNCPICNTLSQVERRTEIPSVKCSRCGDYSISDRALGMVETALQSDNFQIQHFLKMTPPENGPPDLYIEVAKKALNVNGLDIPRSIISHVLRKREDKRTILTGEILANILKNNYLPTPAEIANNFVSFLGVTLNSPGSSFQLNRLQGNIYGLLGIKTGTDEFKDFYFITEALEEQKIVKASHQIGATSGGRRVLQSASLTLEGWQKYEELQRSVKDSRRALSRWSFLVQTGPQQTTISRTHFSISILFQRWSRRNINSKTR